MPRQQRRAGAYTRPLSSLLKQQLVQLADEFELPSAGGVKDLRRTLKAYLDDHRDDLADNPTYRRLYPRRRTRDSQ